MNVLQLQQNINDGLWVFHVPTQRYRRVNACSLDGTVLQLAQVIKLRRRYRRPFADTVTNIYHVPASECRRAYMPEFRAHDTAYDSLNG